MAQTAQTRMAMYNLNLLSNDNIPEDGEEREDGWEGCCSIDDEKWNMVDFEAIC
jgi:peptide deformylase